MFSCLGDGLLVWRELFLYGMVSFGIGHMFFISAFGFQPLNLSLGIPMYIASMFGIHSDEIALGSSSIKHKLISHAGGFFFI